MGVTVRMVKMMAMVMVAVTMRMVKGVVPPLCFASHQRADLCPERECVGEVGRGQIGE